MHVDLCSDCVISGCTVVITLLSQYAQIHNITVAQALEKVCTIFARNPEYEKLCRETVEFISPVLIDL